MNIHYIDQLEQLAEIAKWAKTSEWVAIDTEFDRSQSFYAKLGLIQLTFSAMPEQQYLIDTVALDPLEIARKGGLIDMLRNQDTVKILHACGEDIDALLHNFAIRSAPRAICNLFDTQIAAAYLNLGSQIGYRDLVQHFIGKTLSKDETRSDWVGRPLSPEQLEYAANDVKYLLPCYQQLKIELDQLQRYGWVIEDSERFVTASQQDEALDRYYLKFRHGWNFDRKQVSLLRDLCVWREEMARRMDTPRTHIVRDSSLFEIAEKQPSNLKGLLRLKSLQGKSRDIRHVKQYASQILAQVNVLDEKVEEQELPPQPIEPPLERDLKALFKACKKVVVDVAEREKIPQERLASKNELHRLVAAYAHHLATQETLMLPKLMQGWRKPFVLKPVCDVLDQFQDQLVERYNRLERKATRWQQESEKSDQSNP